MSWEIIDLPEPARQPETHITISPATSFQERDRGKDDPRGIRPGDLVKLDPKLREKRYKEWYINPIMIGHYKLLVSRFGYDTFIPFPKIKELWPGKTNRWFHWLSALWVQGWCEKWARGLYNRALVRPGQGNSSGSWHGVHYILKRRIK